MHLKTKIGFGLIAAGVAVWMAWGQWARTRKIHPVEVPVTVGNGQGTTASFKLNYDGLYLIEVAAKNPAAANAQMATLAAEWSLWSRGQELSRGSTTEAHSAPAQSGGLARVIGEFTGTAGQSYQLQVKFTSDVRGLQTAQATLQVLASGLARENLQATGVLVFSMMFICEMFGMILVGLSLAETKAAKTTV
jgi:hypothetical protein